jgi:hypothetical protein
MRTIRPGVPPSELVVADALRNTLHKFHTVLTKVSILPKFLAPKNPNQEIQCFTARRLATDELLSGKILYSRVLLFTAEPSFLGLTPNILLF